MRDCVRGWVISGWVPVWAWVPWRSLNDDAWVPIGLLEWAGVSARVGEETSPCCGPCCAGLGAQIANPKVLTAP